MTETEIRQRRGPAENPYITGGIDGVKYYWRAGFFSRPFTHGKETDVFIFNPRTD